MEADAVVTPELGPAGQQGMRVAAHEQAAHQKRNWVRLTYHCNDRCIFCLDSDTHDGTDRDRDAVTRQIIEGRRAGAQRLILSGGEPTIHPDFIGFVRLGRRAGYERIQTVTNGRMFAYGDFLRRSLDAGLGEITFSIHGPNAKIHDALVGVKGAWEEEIRGLTNALADGRPIVNIDVCVNRANVRHLPQMLETYYAMGVREFDLLQIIPFGRAFAEGQDTLFYDLEEARQPLEQALQWSKRTDVHLWMNRFPVEHLEGYESLIQDPYKLQDEVRGRKEEYRALIDHGIALDCRAPERCRYCYVSRLCDHLDETRAQLDADRFDVVRLDATWEAKQPPVYGGDPASAKRSLPIIGTARPKARSVADRLGKAQPRRAWIVAPDVSEARALAKRLRGVAELELELLSYDGLPDSGSLDSGLSDVLPVVRAHATSPQQAERLLRLPTVAVVVHLNRDTARWLLGLPASTVERLVLKQPNHERLTESRANDVDLRAFFAAFEHPVAVQGVVACLLGSGASRPHLAPQERVLDTAQLDADGRLEIFRYARRFVASHYYVKSRRCRTCVHDAACRGQHVNYVRAHGFAGMQPMAALPG